MLQKYFHWLLIAAAVVMCLNSHSAEATHNEELEDVPIVNYNKLFNAYIAMGDALFGSWKPVNYAEEAERHRYDEE